MAGMKKRALMLAPHPDDESLTGLLALRLQEECGYEVWVTPFSLGSLRARRGERKGELRAACEQLGFRLKFLAADGEGRVVAEGLAGWLGELRPEIFFVPHAKDGHATHRAAHRAGVAALDAAGGRQAVVETEYWHPLERPNLMVAAGRGHLARLRGALACHRGELARHDYSASLAAWMRDNTRRGAERIGGAGAVAPKFRHSTLYRARWREGGRWGAMFRGGRVIGSRQDLNGWAGMILQSG